MLTCMSGQGVDLGAKTIRANARAYCLIVSTVLEVMDGQAFVFWVQ